MVLQGLVSKREYNRKSARVMSFDDLVARYMVALDDGKELSLIEAECVTREGGQSVDGKVHEPVVALAAAQPTALYVLSWANGSLGLYATLAWKLHAARSGSYGHGKIRSIITEMQLVPLGAGTPHSPGACQWASDRPAGQSARAS